VGGPATWLTPVRAEAAPDPAAEIYDPGRMYVIDLELPQESIDALEDTQSSGDGRRDG
jgi:hypothetical protein